MMKKIFVCSGLALLVLCNVSCSKKSVKAKERAVLCMLFSFYKKLG